MVTAIYRSVVVTVLFAILLCAVYPLAVMGIGKLIFNDKANGGIIRLQDGRIVGARLIGQAFAKPEYFHGRPSSAGSGYDGANSSGSNLGPTNPKLADAVKANVEAALKENPSLKRGEIPVDMVTGSGSGLDPHVSPANALAQVARVASARGASADELRKLVQDHIEGPQLGIFGEPVVNVLLLNLELDRLMPRK
jgi:K+-transporting ATPase ATPase C chain